MSLARITAILSLACLLAPAAHAAGVTLDGVPVPKAVSSMKIDVDVTEFREGGEPNQCSQLILGCPHPKVCLHTPARVDVLDAQLAGAAPAHFAVGVEDGRSFLQCVLNSLEAEGANQKRRYHYCLLCEAVSGP